jgi:hypothetical protein
VRVIHTVGHWRRFCGARRGGGGLHAAEFAGDLDFILNP